MQDSFLMKTVETIRKRLDLTHYGLAKKLGLTQPGLIHLERKSKGIQIITLSRLRKLSGLSWEEVGVLIDRDAAAIERERKSVEKQGE